MLKPTTIELGAAFEARVTAYYEALGFKIERNALVGNHQVDLLVSKYVPGASVLSYMVEAKFRDHDAVGVNEVTAFLNVARDLIALGEINGAIIVTNTRFTKDAMGKGLGSKLINLLTISQLETEIFATSESLLRTCSDYERQKIRDEYIPLSGTFRPQQSNCISDIAKHLREWAETESGLITLIGDFGSGKTTIMDRLFYDIAKSRIDSGSGRYPVQIKLRSLLRYNTLWSFIANSLRDSQYITPEKSVFEAILSAGGFVFLLDGFDEIHTSATSGERATYLKRLMPLLSSPCPCILSTRPTYFTNFREMNNALQYLLEPPAKFARLERSPVDPNWLLKQLNIANPESISVGTLSNAIEIDQLNENSILQYLELFRSQIIKVTGGNEKNLLVFLYKIYDIRDLLSRPLLLNMIIVAIVDGGLDITRTKATIGPSTLYDIYTQTCAQRDAYNRPSIPRLTSVLTYEERLAGCRELAMAMLRKGSIELQPQEVHEAVARLPVMSQKLPKNVSSAEFRERVLTDIRICSFLSFGNGEILRFAHKSFFEFFVAQEFLIQVGDRLSAISTFARFNLSKEIVGFLGSYVRDQEVFARQIVMAFRNQGGPGTKVDSMFYRIALASGFLLETVELKSEKILDTDLRRASVSSATLDHVSLGRVEIDNVTATNWRCGNVSLNTVLIQDCNFASSHLELQCRDVNLQNLFFDECQLFLNGSEVNLENVTFGGGSALLDFSGDVRGFHAKSANSIILGSSLNLGPNASLTISGSVVIQGSGSSWYQNAADIVFSECIFLGLFVPDYDLGVLAARPPKAIRFVNCKGIVLTRGARIAQETGYYTSVHDDSGKLLIVNADILADALGRDPIKTGPLDDAINTKRRRLGAKERSDRNTRLLAAIKSVDSVASRASFMTGLLAKVFEKVEK